MNILTEELPEVVEIDGEEYPINTDFRDALRTIIAFEDEELTDREKVWVMLSNLYPTIPPNIVEASRLGFLFLNGGESAENDEDDGHPLRLYSFTKDHNLIFAAFSQTHGIDLSQERLHWWRFLALFMDLGQETTICALIGLRKRVYTGTASADDRKLFRELGDMAEVTQYRSPEEKAAEEAFFALVKRGKNKT